MNMANLQAMLGGGGGAGKEAPQTDTSEQIYISSLALLKMLKHSRAGVPLEVMGLMLGEFVDEYTIKVVDVFAMPQSGTAVSVESVDPVFQTNMIEMLKQTNRNEVVVGWYHSHPGFGCWLSSVDMNTQQSFEQLNQRAVAVVIDPIQSVKGKVVLDAFRLIPQQFMLNGLEPRQTTSNLGHINKPSVQALYHGLHKHYYPININYRKNDLEIKMLQNLYKDNWSTKLKLQCYEENTKENEENLMKMARLAKDFTSYIEAELKFSSKEMYIKNVGKINPKKHLQNTLEETINTNLVQVLGSMINTEAF